MSEQRSGGAVALTWFAAIVMMVAGACQALAGLAGILKDGFYAVTANYVFEFNTTGWGWLHLLWGILLILAAFGLFSGAVWARMVGVILASIAVVVNFMFLPLYPIWSLILIALDSAVIWALTAHGRDITKTRDT